MYYQEYPLNENIDDIDFSVLQEFNNKLVIFYSTWNFVIYLSCINILSFYGLYKVLKLLIHTCFFFYHFRFNINKICN